MCYQTEFGNKKTMDYEDLEPIAGGGIRTPTPVRTLRPEHSVSASFTTPAFTDSGYYSNSIQHRQDLFFHLEC